jgi:integrase
MRTKAPRARPSRSRLGRAGPGPGIRKAALPSPAGLRLYTADGARKYVTAGERETFLREAERADRLVRTLCMTLTYAGSRLSEALALTADRVDLAAGMLVFETLKKRQAGIYRAVPSPLPCSMRSNWCTASASSRRVVARGVPSASGPGRA